MRDHLLILVGPKCSYKCSFGGGGDREELGAEGGSMAVPRL